MEQDEEFGPDVVADSDRHSSRSRRGRGTALVAAGLVAGAAIAGAAGAVAASGSSGTPTAEAASSASAPEATPKGHPGNPGPGGPNSVRSDEQELTGTAAAKAKAAALAAVPGATIIRVETDAGDGVYEAHLKKSDGTLATVKLDKDFSLIKVESGMGLGDPKPAGVQAPPE